MAPRKIKLNVNMSVGIFRVLACLLAYLCLFISVAPTVSFHPSNFYQYIIFPALFTFGFLLSVYCMKSFESEVGKMFSGAVFVLYVTVILFLVCFFLFEYRTSNTLVSL